MFISIGQERGATVSVKHSQVLSWFGAAFQPVVFGIVPKLIEL